ncbi:MAG TPA: D-alanyl-D-alanine carboxypeptidase family protein, partial [Rhabdaerophilum sp.]|nr:D-alanyl-D-alanine carboxypeptidase family protein [Rhabdaerophilum sp.]
ESLVKLMTAAIVFRELKEGRLSPEADMVVSTGAWRKGGAVAGVPNMLLTPNKVIKVGELVNGLVVVGANDAALALAENIAGTEDRFVEMMNAYAKKIGLGDLLFGNATGLAGEGQAASLRDLTRLAAHVIEAYPEQYSLFAQKDMAIGRGRQVSRNPLLTMDIGADGLMTGTAGDGSHLLIGSAVQEGRRLIVAIAGVKTLQDRALEARKLLEWGFRRFEMRDLFRKGQVLGEVSLYGGESIAVPVAARSDVRLPLLRGTNEGMTLRLSYRGPVPAPVTEGVEIARVEVLVDGRVIQVVPLVAARSVAQGGIVARARDAAIELARQWAREGWDWLSEKARNRRSGQSASAVP